MYKEKKKIIFAGLGVEMLFIHHLEERRRAGVAMFCIQVPLDKCTYMVYFWE